MRIRSFLFLAAQTFVLTAMIEPACTATVEVSKQDELSVILLDGELKLGDEKKFADAAISVPDALVVLKSNGGNLYAGIEIGKAIRLKGFNTLVPDETLCASACALAWLGGRVRAMGTTAKVGFHAASNADDGKVTSSGNALMGAYLSQIGLPTAAVIYITEPPPNSIRWLTAQDASEYGIDVKILSLPADEKNSDRSNAPHERARRAAGNQSTQEKQAIAVVEKIYGNLQNDSEALRWLNGIYADEVLYFGKNLEKSAILADKERFFTRWPIRSYRIDYVTLSASCLPRSCTVNGSVDWNVKSPQRNAEANGAATFAYTIDFSSGRPVIFAETSATTKRNGEGVAPERGDSRQTIAANEQRALDFIDSLFAVSSRDNESAKALYSHIYADRVDYFAKETTKRDVLRDKFNYLIRWPERQYRPDPHTYDFKCSTSQCEIKGVVDWTVKSSARNVSSEGSSAFDYVVEFQSGAPMIILENSSNIQRNAQNTQNPAELLLENTLKCDHDFEPAQIIELLQKEGVIEKKPISEENGIPTYLVIKPTKVFGKDIKIVEGWSPNKMFHSTPSDALKHIAVGIGEPVSFDYKKSLMIELEQEYPPCYSKLGVRDNLFSNYRIKVGDKNKFYFVHNCSIGGQFMRDLKKCIE